MLTTLKGSLRPIYHRLTGGIKVERESNISIAEYGSFEIAHRPGTDAVIAGNYASYTSHDLLPSYSQKPRGTIIHIGAHIGVSALVAAAEAPDCTIHAIEASQDSFNLLRINLALNHAQNVRAQHLAISDAEGEVRLYHDLGHWGHSITRPMSRHFERVPAVTLEQFLDRMGIDRCHILYLNCEGAEFPILLGANASTLQRFDHIVADCHPHLANGKSIQDIVSHLEGAGLKSQVLEHEGSYDRVAASSEPFTSSTRGGMKRRYEPPVSILR